MANRRFIKTAPIMGVIVVVLSFGALAAQAPIASATTVTAAIGTHGSAALPGVESCSNQAGAVSVRPTSIGKFCADGGAVASGITWSKYTSTAASGLGRLTYNTCTPACVDANDLLYTVKITLSKPEILHGHLVFEDMTMVPNTGHDPSLSSSSPGSGWGTF